MCSDECYCGVCLNLEVSSGCYKGQETISRLITYDGIKQRLWGIRLTSPVEPGTPIMVDAKKVNIYFMIRLLKHERSMVFLVTMGSLSNGWK